MFKLFKKEILMNKFNILTGIATLSIVLGYIQAMQMDHMAMPSQTDQAQVMVEQAPTDEFLTGAETGVAPEEIQMSMQDMPMTQMAPMPAAETPARTPRGKTSCKAFAQVLKGMALDTKETGGVCVVAKPRPVSVVMKDVPTKSPLISAALFSSEKGADKYLNLGETAGTQEEITILRDELTKRGIEITAIHTHWLDTQIEGKPAVLMYMHWADDKMVPLEFAKATNDAWEIAFKADQQKAAPVA
jgi:hypothetical protein